MTEFINDTGTIYWWLSVVVVGILVNVLSSYIKLPFDWVFGKISQKWRDRREKSQAERERKILLLRDDYELRVIYAHSEMRYRIRSVGALVMSTAFFGAAILVGGIAGLVALFISLISMLVSSSDHRSAMEAFSLITESTPELKKL
ncbi:TPA: hypothetical protein P0E28_005019 [Vibrio campbellii]|nr:hypothetical protein [Vibrio campbellii]